MDGGYASVTGESALGKCVKSLEVVVVVGLGWKVVMKKREV